MWGYLTMIPASSWKAGKALSDFRPASFIFACIIGFFLLAMVAVVMTEKLERKP